MEATKHRDREFASRVLISKKLHYPQCLKVKLFINQQLRTVLGEEKSHHLALSAH